MQETAKEFADIQRHYDRLHHEKRLSDFNGRLEGHWTKHEVNGLIKQSERCVSDKTGMTGFNSVDLGDAEYIAELDAFAMRNGSSQAA